MSELYVCKQYDTPYERVCKIITNLEEHDSELLNKVAELIKDNMCSCDDKEAGECNANECGFEIEIGTIHKTIDDVIEEMKKDTHTAT